jgi:PAS domain S-box-containing protein
LAAKLDASAWVDRSPGPALAVDASRRIAAANGALAACLAATPKQLIGSELSSWAVDPAELRDFFAAKPGTSHTIRLRDGHGGERCLALCLGADLSDGVCLVSALDLGTVPGDAATALTATLERAEAAEQRYRDLATGTERYRRFFAIASDWFWETDRKYCLTYVSPNIEAATGLPGSHYLGRRFSDTAGVTIAPEMAQKAVAAYKAKTSYSDVRYSRTVPDGRVIWLSSNGSPMFGDDGAFRGYCGITRVITPQVEWEQTLREREQQARHLFEVAADYYWEMDDQHFYTLTTPGFEKLLGLAPGELIGKRLNAIAGISIDPEMGRMVLSSIKAKQPFRDYTYSRKFPDGKTKWFKGSGTPYYDKGVFKGYRGVGAEITARVEAEAAARLTQSQLHDAVAYVSQAFVLYDAAGRAVAYNQAFTDLHANPGGKTPVCQGVSFRELAEWQLATGFYANSPDDASIDLATLLERFKAEGEHSDRLRDGRWMMVIYRHLPGGGKVGLWTDITALKRAEAERRMLETQLHHSQRLEALGTLAGGAAHEINNALVPVIALTKLVAGRLPEDSRDRRNLGTVLVGAERSRELVKQILAFSHKESEEQPPQQPQSVDVAAVLRDALKLMRATVPTSISFEEQITAAPPIAGDPNKLHQVIVNIVTNASHAIGADNGTITVGLRFEAERGAVRFWVMDSGCGMDEATKERIFEPFFTTKEVGKGTGLGLSVVHGIIKSHGGQIEVESAPGRGTRFDIVLPIQAAEAAA